VITPRIGGMSPTPPDSGLLRPAAVVNEDIRNLMLRTGGWLTPEDRAEYQRLREEWTRAA
jgi:hypothetical protein